MLNKIITILICTIALPALASTEVIKSDDLPTVVIITTGGTIAMKYDKEQDAIVQALSGDEIVNAVPGLDQLARIELIEFMNITSENMTPKAWHGLSSTISQVLKRKDVAGVIVTHGTDTLEETAYFLELTVDSSKPVIVTGSQRSSNERDADGPRNIYNAVKVAVDHASIGKGVLVVLNRYINAARDVIKVHTSNVQTFQSGAYGYLGYVDLDRVVFYRESNRTLKFTLPPSHNDLPQVDMVMAYTGATGKFVRHATATGAKGLVVQGFGLGNVSQVMFGALKAAHQDNVQIVISSRVPQGRVLPLYGNIGGGATLKEIGSVFSDDLPPWKARILLMLALTGTDSQEELQEYFDR